MNKKTAIQRVGTLRERELCNINPYVALVGEIALTTLDLRIPLRPKVKRLMALADSLKQIAPKGVKASVDEKTVDRILEVLEQYLG